MSSETAPSPNSSIFNQSFFNNTTGTSGLDLGYLALNYLAYPTSQLSTETLYSLETTTSHIPIDNIDLGSGENEYSTTNTVCGVDALPSASGTGLNNVAVGYNALELTTTGDSNVAVGFNALSTNISGIHNTAVGYNALLVNTSNYNTAIGDSSLVNSVATSNTAVGSGAGGEITLGTNNTFIGYNADTTAIGSDDSTVIGSGANTTASNMIVLGTSADSLLYYPYFQTLYTSPSFPAGSLGNLRSNSNTSVFVGGATVAQVAVLTITEGTWVIFGTVYANNTAGSNNLISIAFGVGTSPTYFPSSYGAASIFSNGNALLPAIQVYTTISTTTSINLRLGAKSSNGAFQIGTGRGLIKAIRVA